MDSGRDAGMVVELIPVDQLPKQELEYQWRALEGKARQSFFLSWTWIGAWLSALDDRSALRIVRISLQGDAVALGVISLGNRRRLLDLLDPSARLHQTGNPLEDRITIEHNGLLVADEDTESAWLALERKLCDAHLGWSGLNVSAVSRRKEQKAIASAALSLGMDCEERDEKPYYWVNLETVRSRDTGYLSLLSANTRYQIRRALRSYSQSGQLRVEAGISVADTVDAFEKLVSLHQAYWSARGDPGAFGNDFARRFHHHLITSGTASGHVQLLSVLAGDEVIGYLYNFVYNSRVSAYQGGFVYGTDSKRKPGLVCHCAAIEHNSNLGHSAYDFLMGDAQYKRSLATEDDTMRWLVLTRPFLRFRLVRRLRRWKRRLRAN